MQMLRLLSPLAAAVVLFLPSQAAAQAQNVAPQLPGCSWNCYNVRLPYGLYVREVVDGGSYVILEDGSVWEIRLPQRPIASSWVAGDFVQLKPIHAPVENFEILLTHGDDDRAEARLAGRDKAPDPDLPQE